MIIPIYLNMFSIFLYMQVTLFYRIQFESDGSECPDQKKQRSEHSFMHFLPKIILQLLHTSEIRYAV